MFSIYISYFLVKTVQLKTMEVFLCLINFSFIKAKFPEQIERAVVTPLHNKKFRN